MVDGFEDYVTGYPLVESSVYAFARTWHAPEMKRPGCVWTHTLLIDMDDVGRLKDLSVLEGLFARPSSMPQPEEYRQPLHVLSGAESAAMRPFQAHLVAAGVLSWLYNGTDVPVLVPVESAQTYHGLVVAIWNQQWPSLRASFAFCTGALGSRSILGRAFDLQLIPSKSTREIRRDVPLSSVVDPSVARPLQHAEWLELALRDVEYPDVAFRSSVERTAKMLSPLLTGRRCFEPAVELLMATELLGSGVDNVHRILDAVGARFPDPAQAKLLKIAVANGSPSSGDEASAPRDYADVLLELGTTAYDAAFAGVELHVEQRMLRMWMQDRPRAEWLLDQLLCTNHNVLGEAMLAAVIAASTPAELGAIFGARPSFLIAAVRRDSALAGLPSVWLGSSERQREIFDAATSGVDVSDERRELIVTGMLEAGVDVVAEQVFRRFGESVVPVVLRYIERNGDVGAGWIRQLSAFASIVLEWSITSSAVSSAAAAIVPRVLNPHSAEVRRTAVAPWLVLVARSEGLTVESRTALCAFALAVGFDRSEPDACALIRATFSAVHVAAAEKRLEYNSWAFLEECVPYHYRNWDKCERLRRGLIDRFARYEWPSSEFVLTAGTRDALVELLRTCYEYGGSGRRMLKRLKSDYQELRNVLPAEWESVVRYWV